MGSKKTKELKPAEADSTLSSSEPSSEQRRAAEKAMETMIEFFSVKCNLKVPYVPEDLRPLWRQKDVGVWWADVTGESHSLYGACQRTLALALERDEESDVEKGEHFLILGNSGRGINGWYMYYYLSHKPLYMTWCTSYGGAYGNHETDVEAVNAGFEILEKIFHRVQDLINSGKIDLKWRITSEGDDNGVSGPCRRWSVKNQNGEELARGHRLHELLEHLEKMVSES